MFNQSNLLILKGLYNIHKSFLVHSLSDCTSAEMKQADQEDPLWHSENLKQTHTNTNIHIQIYMCTQQSTQFENTIPSVKTKYYLKSYCIYTFRGFYFTAWAIMMLL